jgi:hypothetical protein
MSAGRSDDRAGVAAVVPQRDAREADVAGEIAEKLNVEKVSTIHGTNRWTAASVRKAFVS